MTLRIAVVGNGYVGTVVAACFARFGHDVIGLGADITDVVMAMFIDGRNLLDAAAVADAGLVYEGIGRSSVRRRVTARA